MGTLKDRLKLIAEQKGLSIRAFEERCGLGRGNISNMSPDGTLGSDKLTKIIDTFTEIDLYWLLTGTHSENTNQTHIEETTDESQLIDKLLQQAEEIGRLKERIAQLEREKGKDVSDAQISGVANVG